jgi:hypothetical protein
VITFSTHSVVVFTQSRAADASSYSDEDDGVKKSHGAGFGSFRIRFDSAACPESRDPTAACRETRDEAEDIRFHPGRVYGVIGLDDPSKKDPSAKREGSREKEEKWADSGPRRCDCFEQ